MDIAVHTGNTISLNLVPHDFDLTETNFTCTISVVWKDGRGDLTVTIPKPNDVDYVAASLTPVVGMYRKYDWSQSWYGDIAALLYGNWVNCTYSYSGEPGVFQIYGTDTIGLGGTITKEAPNNIQVTIDANFPIFAFGETIHTDALSWYIEYADTTTATSYVNQITHGVYTNLETAINFGGAREGIDTSREYFIISQVKKNGVVQSFKHYKFTIMEDAKISLAHSGDDWILQITEMPYKYIDLSNGGYSSISWTETNVLLPNHVAYPYNEDYAINDDLYTVWLYTNIPRFDSVEQRNKYNAGEIGIDSAIDGGGSYKTSPIGEILGETDIDTSTFDASVSGSNVYLLSSSDLADVKNYLFDPNKKTVLSDGLWAWGNAPISALIGLYYVPFDVSDFYTTITAGIKFGSHVATDLGYKTLATVGGDMKDIFSTSLEGKYGDFRDYDYMSYEIYLPYVGKFIPLDPGKFLNKMVECKAVFDAHKHELRYYLFANGIIQERIDATVGVDLPLISTDNVSKAKTDIASKFNDLNNIASALGGIASGDATTAMSSIFSAGTKIAQNTMQRATKPVESITGGYSSALNTLDVRYPYLRLTEKPTIKPTKLNTIYNYPSYYMGVCSNLHGYCEISDIQLVSTATQPEIDEIISLLRSGVIL